MVRGRGLGRALLQAGGPGVPREVGGRPMTHGSAPAPSVHLTLPPPGQLPTQELDTFIREVGGAEGIVNGMDVEE